MALETWLGIRGRVSRNTLAHANATRNWRLYAEFAQRPIGMARTLYAEEPFGVDVANIVRAGLHHDRSVVAAVPLGAVSLDPGSGDNAHAAGLAWQHPQLHSPQQREAPRRPHPQSADSGSLGAFHVMDRGDIDFARLYRLHQAGSFFVTRAKKNMHVQRRYSHPVDRSTGVRFDQTLVLQSYQSAKDYPQPLRGVHHKDPETGKRLLVHHPQHRAARAEHLCFVPG